MNNKRMEEKINAGTAVDVSKFHREGAYYILPGFADDGKDYCDAKTESWVWSIGRRKSDGVILASLGGDLYLNPGFECLWLR